jgi:hypothetical protein
MRRIDLFCKLVGPLAVSAIDPFSTKLAVFITLGINAACIPIEYLAIAKVGLSLLLASAFLIKDRYITLFLISN